MKKYIVVLFFLGIYWGQAQTTEYNTKENQPYYPTTVNQKDVYIKERCVLDIYYPKNKTGFGSLIAVFSNPFASYGKAGYTTFKPGVLVNQASLV